MVFPLVTYVKQQVAVCKGASRTQLPLSDRLARISDLPRAALFSSPPRFSCLQGRLLLSDFRYS